MSFRPNFDYKQEMPPKGGFPKIDFFERARARGPSAVSMWVFAVGATVYGYYMISSTNHEKFKEEFLCREAKMTMVPFLQAESDLAYLERKREFLKTEAEIMKDVPGWVVGQSVYKTDRWVPENPYPLTRWNKK